MEGSARQKLRDLSGQFFTIVPHRIGRSKMDVEKNVIDTFGVFEGKQELLQLMKDLLDVTGLFFVSVNDSLQFINYSIMP